MEKDQYDYIDTLILRYVDGTIDSRSLARLKSWAGVSDARRAYVRGRLETAFSSAVAADHTPFDSHAAYARFLSRAAVECGRGRRFYGSFRMVGGSPNEGCGPYRPRAT